MNADVTFGWGKGVVDAQRDIMKHEDIIPGIPVDENFFRKICIEFESKSFEIALQIQLPGFVHVWED